MNTPDLLNFFEALQYNLDTPLRNAFSNFDGNLNVESEGDAIFLADSISASAEFILSEHGSTSASYKELENFMGMIVANEAYMGKHPLLISAEKAFDRLREIQAAEFNKFTKRDIEKQCAFIGSLFAKLFNFKEMRISLLDEGFAQDEANAATLLFGSTHPARLEPQDIEIEENSYRFKKANRIAWVILFGGMLRQHTSEVIVGIMLHEIGHNFSVAWNHFFIRQYMEENKDTLSKAEAAEIADKFNPDGKTAVREDKDKQRDSFVQKYEPNKRRKVSFFVSIIYFVILAGSTVFSTLMAPIGLLSVFLLKLRITLAKGKNMRSQAYNDEKFSDEFAMAYGYGGTLASYLNGTDYVSNWLADYLCVIDLMLAPIFGTLNYEPHPSAKQRLANTKAFYIKALSMTNDAKMRTEIIANIKAVEKIEKENAKTKRKFSLVQFAQEAKSRWVDDANDQEIEKLDREISEFTKNKQ